MNTELLLQNKIPCEQTGIEIKKTICGICEGPGASCGINAYVKDGRVIKVEGNPDYPPSHGTLCSKGNANRQYVYHKDRLLTPLKRTGPRGSGEFAPISWEEAYATIAQKLLQLKADFGPESVCFGVGFTKWLRPFAQRLCISFGSPNFVTESSTCFLATALASTLNYGQWFGVPDVANTQCVLIWSSNFMHTSTTMAEPMLMAKKHGVKMVEISPMVTPFTKHADYHLALRPGTDGALALGFAHIIINEDLYDHEFVQNWTHGFDEFKAYVREFTPERTAEITGVPAADIIAAACLYGGAERATINFSASPTVHHTNGVQNHRAITLLAGLTGNYDRPGGNFFVPEAWLHVGGASKTRQEEFMGVERLNDLKARPIGDAKFPLWTRFIGEAQTLEFPFQIESGQPYPLKAFIGFGFNKRILPGNDYLIEQMQKLDFIVNAELFMTDTCTQLADIVLPVCSTFERSELKVYPGDYYMWTQPAIKPLGEAKSDAEIIFELAKRIAPEDKLMSKGYEACVDWILEPTGTNIEQLKQHSNGLRLSPEPIKPEKYREKGFKTPTGKMEFTSELLREIGQEPLPKYQEPKYSPVSTPDIAKDYPLVLGTGSRVPMYHHSRTFRLGWDAALQPKPQLYINNKDAAARGINNGDAVMIKTPRHAVEAWATVSDRIVPGAVNIYHGWPNIEVNWLIEPDYQDPVSGFPGFKSLLCEVVKK